MPAWKRASDLLWILLALPVVLILGLAVYCWIKKVSRGPVLFRQTRIGRGGKPFTIYKFRSMKPDAPTGLHRQHVRRLITSGEPMTKLDLLGDPRLIKGGCMIRMAGLDELPQLINVLRGEMSLIGPRPCVPDEFELYDEDQRRRFSVQPGLTGLWQVRRTPSTTFPAMVEMDVEYVARMSPWLDFRILAQTPAVLYRQIRTCTPRKAESSSAGRAAARPSPLLPAQQFVRQISPTRKLAD